MALKLTNTVQAQRKAIILRDTTPLFSELGVAEGWGTDFDFADYVIAGAETATLQVIRNSYDGVTETVNFDLTALGFFEAVTDQASLVYNIVVSGGVMECITSSAFDASLLTALLDGLYTVTYSLTGGGTPVTYTSTFVVKDGAVSVLDAKALNLDNKIFSSNTDMVELIDIVVLESMLFTVERSDVAADASIIKNLLKVINNEEYEYYRE